MPGDGRGAPADGIYRVPGGWHLPGDLTVTSGDVADGRPRAVSLLRDPDYRTDEGWQILADTDPGEADALAAWADAQREYLTPGGAVQRARAALQRGDREACEAALSELDDLDSVGWPEAGALRDQIAGWLGLFGEDPYDEEDGR